jgi:hypothetical protein
MYMESKFVFHELYLRNILASDFAEPHRSQIEKLQTYTQPHAVTAHALEILSRWNLLHQLNSNIRFPLVVEFPPQTSKDPVTRSDPFISSSSLTLSRSKEKSLTIDDIANYFRIGPSRSSSSLSSIPGIDSNTIRKKGNSSITVDWASFLTPPVTRRNHSFPVINKPRREISNSVTTTNSFTIGTKISRAMKTVKRRSVLEWIVICLSWVK